MPAGIRPRGRVVWRRKAGDMRSPCVFITEDEKQIGIFADEKCAVMPPEDWIALVTFPKFTRPKPKENNDEHPTTR